MIELKPREKVCFNFEERIKNYQNDFDSMFNFLCDKDLSGATLCSMRREFNPRFTKIGRNCFVRYLKALGFT